MADRTSVDHWNYRVVERVVGDETVVDMIEVFYDADDKIVGWTPASVDGYDSLGNLNDSLRLMAESVRDKPVLTPADLLG